VWQLFGFPKLVVFWEHKHDEALQTPVDRLRRVVVLAEVHVRIGEADAEGAICVEDVGTLRPPAEMTEEQTFRHADVL
jgi:hypothetical protein